MIIAGNHSFLSTRVPCSPFRRGRRFHFAGMVFGIFAVAWGNPVHAGSPDWPASIDVTVAPPSEYAESSVAAGPAGELYVALSFTLPSGSIGIRVLRSLDSGDTFDVFGSFEDSNPEHNFAEPSLVHIDNPGELVLAMLEQTPAGYAVRVARTPVGQTPDWQLTTAATGETLIEPDLAHDPIEAGRLYLIYRSYRVDHGFNVDLNFLRSTNGGANWSAPRLVGSTTLPVDMTGAAVMAGPDSVVHVAWVAADSTGGRIIHRRHLQAGLPSIPFQPETPVAGPIPGIIGVRLAEGSGPEMVALYLRGDGTLRCAWSPDAGATFPVTAEIVVPNLEGADNFDAVGQGQYAHIVYRVVSRELHYRSLLLPNPTQVSDYSLVSDLGEPAADVSLGLRTDMGPAALWFADQQGGVRPFLDAYWFDNTLAVEGGDLAPRMPEITLAPNPFRNLLTIELQIAEPVARAHVAVVAASGRRVALIHDGPLGAGPVRLVWDGRGAGGDRLPAGVYYLEAALPNGIQRGRAVLLR